MLVAIVGAAGSGKSTALQIAAESGFKTINMDRYVHEQYKHGEAGYSIVRKLFGDEYVTLEGVDRAKLSRLVFKDPASFESLKKAIYPLVVQKLALLSGDWIVEMPAFTNEPELWSRYFSAVVLIRARKAKRKERITKKFSGVDNLSTSVVDKYVNLVNPHLRDASYIVDNDGTREEFAQAVKSVLRRIFKA